ncbi:MAG: hypothetical protein J6C13_00365 [Clostridia bacterium]|nr:hypothetical protein [Clostridia bacterium]
MSLEKKEQKFLNNKKLMKKHFKIYNEQAKRAYEFAKTFGAGEELLDRFSKIKIHFFAGFDSNDNGINSKLYKKDKIYSKSSLNTIPEAERNYAVTEDNKTKKEVEYFWAKVETKRREIQEEQSDFLVGFGELFIPIRAEKKEILNPQKLDEKKFGMGWKKDVVLKPASIQSARELFLKKVRSIDEPKKVINVNIEQKQQDYKVRLGVAKFNTAKQVAFEHKTIYHELAHALSSYKIIPSTEVPNFENPQEDSYCVYSGANIQSINILKDGIACIDKRMSGNMYLEEGVVENFAFECMQQEIENSNYENYKKYTVENLMYEIYQNSGYKNMFVLTGMWNAVSKQELFKQHLGIDSKDIVIQQATETFKTCFREFEKSLTGGEYNSQNKREYEDCNIDKIIDNYVHCVMRCKIEYQDAKQVQSITQKDSLLFDNYLDFAQKVDFVVNGFSHHISMTPMQEKECKKKLNESFAKEDMQTIQIPIQQQNIEIQEIAQTEPTQEFYEQENSVQNLPKEVLEVSDYNQKRNLTSQERGASYNSYSREREMER